MVSMTSDFEKEMIRKIFAGFIFVIAAMFVVALYAGNKRQECRLEALKANMPAEDIVKVCS